MTSALEQAHSIGVFAARVGVKLSLAVPAVESIVTPIVPLEQVNLETCPAIVVLVPSQSVAAAAVALTFAAFSATVVFIPDASDKPSDTRARMVYHCQGRGQTEFSGTRS